MKSANKSIAPPLAGSTRALAVIAAILATGISASSAAASTPKAHAAVSCADVIVIGAAGSGERITRTDRIKYRDMGESVWRMASRFMSGMARDLPDDPGYSVDSTAISYTAAGVFETLTPSRGQRTLLLGGGPGLIAAAGFWYRNNFKKYIASINDGINKTVSTVRTIVSRCPESDLVLMGYSQGAMVVHQAEQKLEDAGNEDELGAIAGTILLADGDRVPWTSANEFGAVRAPNGMGVRTKFGGNSSRDVVDPEMTASICDWNDPVCDFRYDFIRHLGVHTGYLDGAAGRRTAAAVDWLVNEYRGV